MEVRSQIKKEKGKLNHRYNRFIKASKTIKVENHYFWWAKMSRTILKLKIKCQLLEEFKDDKDLLKTEIDPFRKTHQDRVKEILNYIANVEKKLDKFRDGFLNVKLWYGLSEKSEKDYKNRYNVK
tara:strand:+ start:169 stop:543 length:375 start_codon:yes stop_codon:yes gene_type:complete